MRRRFGRFVNRRKGHKPLVGTYSQNKIRILGVLSIGINYKGQKGELKGCINDSNEIIKFAQELNSQGFKIQMTESKKDCSLKPTKENIQRQLKRAVSLCHEQKCTHFWLHYSGHGGQVRDVNGDESDGKDETLIPLDYVQEGIITDDWMLNNVINKLPPKIKFFGLMDACHSGSILDLKYHIDVNNLEHILVNSKSSRNIQGMMISGCRDHKVSYDGWDEKYGAIGAMTSAFLKAAAINRKVSAISIVRSMRKQLKKRGYPQIPQLSTTTHITNYTRIYGM